MTYSIISLLSLGILISLYVNYTLYKKVMFYENFIENLEKIFNIAYERMTKIDSTGAFASDDEVGSVFDGLKSVIYNLQNIIYEQREEKER